MPTPYIGGKFRLTSIYGVRTLNGASVMHRGIDLVGISSKEICAVTSGKVVQSRIVTDKSNSTWQWGNYICVLGDDGRYYYYCHMSSRISQKGDTVRTGEKIGIEGSTGYSTGSHLHFEVRESGGSVNVNPAHIIGIKNETGIYEMQSAPKSAGEYIRMIVDRVGYDDPGAVIEAFERVEHPHITDVWRKLYEKLPL